MRAPASVAAALLVAVLLPGAADAAPAGAGYELRQGSVKPAHALFDGERRVTVRFSFGATRRLDLLVRIVRARDGKPVRRYRERALAPGKFHELSWDGRRANRRETALSEQQNGNGSQGSGPGPAARTALGRFAPGARTP